MKQEISGSPPLAFKTGMTAETPVAPPETSAPEAVVAQVRPAAPPAPPKMFGIDQRFVAPLFITCILLVGHITTGILESPIKTLLAILTAIAIELVLGRLFTKKWPHIASAYISGISVGILIRSPALWPYALCSAISITSKYVLRVKDRHIWNPSNFGICAMLFLASDTVASLSIQWSNSIWAIVVIWSLGSLIISRLKRFHITLTYVVSFVVFAFIRSAITGHSWQAELAPITGPMYQLYIFFMITDPKTTVHGKRAQMLVAFLVAAMECALRLTGSFFAIHAPYYALFIVGPIANVIDIKRAEMKAAKLSPTPA